MTSEQYVDERTVSRLTGIKLPTLRNNRFQGKGIPYFKIGKSVRYSLKDVQEYFEAHKVRTAE